MIKAISKITIYVENQEAAKKFWTEKMDFIIRLEQQMGPDMTWLEVSPGPESETAFVLYPKKMMESQTPSVTTGHPSLILSTPDIEKAHKEMSQKGIKAEAIQKMPYGSMFTFYDQDNNPYLLRQD